MADARRAEALQPAHSSKNVLFGHFGTSTYDTRNQSWHFLRNDVSTRPVDRDGAVVSSPFRLIQQSRQYATNDLASSADLVSSAKLTNGHFLNSVPEAALGFDACKHQYQSSAQPQLDCSKTDLLAFGNALVLGSDDTQSGLQTVPIAAYALSNDSTRVVLAHIEQQVVSSHMEDVCQIQVPCISKGKTTTLPIERGQILQLIFSGRSLKQDATWLAIRSTSATVICQPLIHRAAAVSFQEAFIDANIMIEIPTSRTGGFQHADIAFHPRDPHRLALVDIAGNWSIWNIKGKRSHSARVLHSAELFKHGFISMQSAKHDQVDGWHKVLWLSMDGQNSDCLLIANRRKIALFDLSGALIVERSAQIGSREKCWLLDLQVGCSSTHFLALSTSQIFSMTIGSLSTGKTHIDIKVDAYWNHFRAHDDNSLRMHLLRFVDAVWILVTSGRHRLVTAWFMQVQSVGTFVCGSISDAVTLNFSHKDNAAYHLAIQRVAVHVLDTNSECNDDCFFKVFTRGKSGEMLEYLYQIHDMFSSRGTVAELVPLPQKSLLSHKTSHRIGVNGDEDDLIDFITADNSTEQHANPVSISEEIPPPVSSDRRQPRICDLQRVYALVCAEFESAKAEDRISLGNALDMVSVATTDLSMAKLLLQLLVEQSLNNIHVAEIEHESNELDQWIQSMHETDISHLGSKLWRPKSFIDTYDEMVDSWISSLSSSISDRARVYRERLLRRVVLELHLSRIHVRPKMPESHPIPQDLPGYFSTRSDSSLLVDPDGPRDLQTSPVVATSQLRESSPINFSLLGQYVEFRLPNTLGNSASAALGDVLGHLPVSPDADPKEYSFSDIELNLALARNEFADQNLDPKAKRKAEKLARARKRQLDKQAQLKKVTFEKTAALPPVLSTQLPIRGVQSSQAGPLNSSQPSLESMPQVSMTQPERGVYGKREAKKVKSKGRNTRQKGF